MGHGLNCYFTGRIDALLTDSRVGEEGGAKEWAGELQKWPVELLMVIRHDSDYKRNRYCGIRESV